MKHALIKVDVGDFEILSKHLQKHGKIMFIYDYFDILISLLYKSIFHMYLL